ncbi:hypothetical protein [Asanoa iriomotensis]|uniref:hypothetical protein n=1 Tax=Asanoa iriomotensis TaxID=234613 RepID=UPI0031D99899
MEDERFLRGATGSADPVWIEVSAPAGARVAPTSDLVARVRFPAFEPRGAAVRSEAAAVRAAFFAGALRAGVAFSCASAGTPVTGAAAVFLAGAAFLAAFAGAAFLAGAFLAVVLFAGAAFAARLAAVFFAGAAFAVLFAAAFLAGAAFAGGASAAVALAAFFATAFRPFGVASAGAAGAAFLVALAGLLFLAAPALAAGAALRPDPACAATTVLRPDRGRSPDPEAGSIRAVATALVCAADAFRADRSGLSPVPRARVGAFPSVDREGAAAFVRAAPAVVRARPDALRRRGRSGSCTTARVPGAPAVAGAFRAMLARSAITFPHVQNGRAAGRRALRRLARIRNVKTSDNMPHRFRQFRP